MASQALENGSKAKAAKPPISTHRAFPFIVSLWFAALLGLGSLMVPVEVIERLSVGVGLPSIIPFAAPPLGMTARLLIALAFTFAGAVAGLFIARQVANAHRSHMDGGRQPIAAHDELGDDGFDATPRSGRRMLAMKEEEGQRSDFLDFAPLPSVTDTIVYEAPDGLETARIGNLELSEDFSELSDELAEQAGEPHAPFELADSIPEAMVEDPFGEDLLAEDQAIEALAPIDANPGFQSLADDDARTGFEFLEEAREGPQAAETESQGFSADTDEAPAEMTSDPIEDMPEMTDEPSTFDQDTAAESGKETPEAPSAQLEELGLVQLAQRLGASIEKRRELRHTKAQLSASATPAPRAVAAAIDANVEQAGAQDAAQAMAAFFGKSASEGQDQPQDLQAPAAQQELAMPDTQDAPVGEPGEEAEPAAAAPQPEPVRPEEETRQYFKPVGGEAPKPPVKEPTSQPFAHFAIPEDDEDEEDGNLAASFALPLDRIRQGATAEPSTPEAAPQAAEEAPTADEADEPEGQGDNPEFGSLLGMGNPFNQRGEEFVRIEDEPEPEEGAVEPAVVFPNATRPFDRPASQESEAMQADNPLDTEENERALREALLNLQRMRGAG